MVKRRTVLPSKSLVEIHMPSIKVLFAAVALASAAAAQAGPLSTLYLTYSASSGFGAGISMVQGNSITSFPVAYSSQFEIPIAVNGDVRTTGYVLGGTGGQYSLNGTPTGTGYVYPLADSSYDSTTDGSHNYLVAFNGGGVYATNTDFTSPTLLFSVQGNVLGITYDETNNSLWLSDWGNTMVSNYSLSGTLLSSFSTGHTQNGALALDHADQTLWLVDDTSGQLQQFSKSGALLSSGPNVGFTLGGEFDFAGAGHVPEPSSLALLGLAGLLLAGQRRRQARG